MFYRSVTLDGLNLQMNGVRKFRPRQFEPFSFQHIEFPTLRIFDLVNFGYLLINSVNYHFITRVIQEPNRSNHE